MKAYKNGTQTLNHLLQSDDLKIEKIEETLDSLADSLADHKEIELCLSSSMNDLTADYDEEVQKELEALIECERINAAEKELGELQTVEKPLGPLGQRQRARTIQRMKGDIPPSSSNASLNNQELKEAVLSS